MPTVVQLIQVSLLSIQAQMRGFWLLSVLAGLLAALFYTPGLVAAQTFMATTLDTSSAEANMDAISQQLETHLPSILLSYLALVAIQGFLLPLWARFISPQAISAWDGNPGAFIARGLQGTWLLVAAAILSLALFAITFGLLSSLGGLGFMLCVAISVWMNLLFTAAAHTAILHQAHNIPLSFARALGRNKPAVRPVVGSLAFVWFITLLASMIISGMLPAAEENMYAARVAAFLQGFLTFLTAALHIAVLYRIPGIFSDGSEEDEET